MNQLFNCISDDYRNISTIENIADEFHGREPIQYYVIDNFINTELYSLVEQEFIEQESFFIHDIKNDSYVSNKTIFLWTPSFLKLYNYFLSDEFELFLEKIFQEKLQKAKKITPEWIRDNCDSGLQWVAQMYGQWDFMWWHIDLAEDPEYLKNDHSDKWVKSIKHTEVGAFVYYVYNSNNSWDKSKWWMLEMGKVSNWIIEPYEEIAPLRNRLVLIGNSSYRSHHRVTQVSSEIDYRISIQDFLIRK